MTAPKKVKLKKYFISKDHEAVAEVMTECDGKETRTGFFCDEIPLDDDSICVVPYSSYLGLSVNKDNFITELKKNHDTEVQALKADLEALVKRYCHENIVERTLVLGTYDDNPVVYKNANELAREIGDKRGIKYE